MPNSIIAALSSPNDIKRLRIQRGISAPQLSENRVSPTKALMDPAVKPRDDKGDRVNCFFRLKGPTRTLQKGIKVI